jgi:hypothetical protein
MRHLMKAAGADAVGALIVFLHLLERQSQTIGQLRLTEVEHKSTHADAAANMVVYRVTPLVQWHPLPSTALVSDQPSVQLLRQCGAFAHTKANCGPNQSACWLRMVGHLCRKDCSMEYAVMSAFLLSVVAGSFAAILLGGYGIAQLIALAL